MSRRAPLALLAGLLIAGCGSAAPSLRAFRASATTICSTAELKSAAIAVPSKPAGEAAFLRRGVALLRPELVRLRKLRAPASVADVYSTALTAFGGKLNALERTLSGLQSGTDPILSIKGLERRVAPLEASEDGAWQALEVPACLNR